MPFLRAYFPHNHADGLCTLLQSSQRMQQRTSFTSIVNYLLTYNKEENIMNDLEEKKSGITQWLGLIIGLIYFFSPVDLIPDIPVVGQVDDFFVLLTGSLDTIQRTCQDSISWLSHIAKLCKWATIILGVIAIALVLLVGAAIVKLFG